MGVFAGASLNRGRQNPPLESRRDVKRDEVLSMDLSRWKRMCVVGSLAFALWVGIPLFAGAPRSQDAQQQAAAGDASASNERSQITNVVVTGSQPAGTF